MMSEDFALLVAEEQLKAVTSGAKARSRARIRSVKSPLSKALVDFFGGGL